VYVCVVYFMNLNKVCLKDNYPLSNIVWLRRRFLSN
jgi:hypothetical protein